MPRLTYEEALGPLDGGSIQRLLQNIAYGKFWYVAEDFTDGRQFDPPELQRAKAGVVLQELIHQLPDTPDPIDRQVQVMLLRLEAEMKFNEAVTKAAQQEPEPEITPIPTASPEPESEPVLSGEEKLKAAKESTKLLKF